MSSAVYDIGEILKEILEELKKIESAIENVAFSVEGETKKLLDYSEKEKKELIDSSEKLEKRMKDEDRAKPATEKQLNYLSDLSGVPVEQLRKKYFTQEQASTAIQEALSKGNYRQVR